MNKTISIEINCGETTCASEPGTFCVYFGSRKFGMVPLCLLFPDPQGGSVTELHVSPDGWVERCPECLKATR